MTTSKGSIKRNQNRNDWIDNLIAVHVKYYNSVMVQQTSPTFDIPETANVSAWIPEQGPAGSMKRNQKIMPPITYEFWDCVIGTRITTITIAYYRQQPGQLYQKLSRHIYTKNIHLWPKITSLQFKRIIIIIPGTSYKGTFKSVTQKLAFSAHNCYLMRRKKEATDAFSSRLPYRWRRSNTQSFGGSLSFLLFPPDCLAKFPG